eukprot:Awhi_evm1s14632
MKFHLSIAAAGSLLGLITESSGEVTKGEAWCTTGDFNYQVVDGVLRAGDNAAVVQPCTGDFAVNDAAVEQVSRTFYAGVSNVNYVNLDSNLISQLNVGVFDHPGLSEELAYLYIRNNKIEQINSGLLQGLDNLESL